MLEPLFQNEEWGFDSKKLKKLAKIESAPGHKLKNKPKKAHFSEKGQKRDKINLLAYMKLLPYSKPKIYRSGPKWHVEYSFDIPDHLRQLPRYAGKKRQRFKEYKNINRLQGEEKEIYAEWLRDQLEASLINGFNPFDQIISELGKLQETADAEKNKAEPLYTVLDTYFKAKIKGGISKKSVVSYQTPINHFKKWLELKGWQDRPADQFTEDDIILFLDEKSTERKWSSWTYNIQREYCFMWFNWMETERIIPKSPLSKRLAKRIESGVSKNESYHGRIRETITKALKEHPTLDRFCKLVYFTCTRPQEETLQIKIADINLQERSIKIYEQGKGGSRHIPVSDELYALLVDEFKINDYPLDYYIASRDCMPGPQPVSKNYYSEKYRTLRRSLNIPDMYGIYSWKHTRINDLLSNGYSDAEVIQLTGHKGTESYDTYKRSVGKHLDSRIKGKTVNF